VAALAIFDRRVTDIKERLLTYTSSKLSFKECYTAREKIK